MDYIEYCTKVDVEDAMEYIDELLSSDEFTEEQKKKIKKLLRDVYKMGRFHVDAEEFMRKTQSGDLSFMDEFGVKGICMGG